MGNLSGESREQNRKDKVTRFLSVTYARYLALLVNTLRSHVQRSFHVNSNVTQSLTMNVTSCTSL